VPVSRTLLAVFRCIDGGLKFAPSEPCWSGTHISMCVLSGTPHPYQLSPAGFALVLFVPVAVRLAVVGGELDRVAVYFWRTWRFDEPPLGARLFDFEPNRLGHIHGMSAKSNVLSIALVCFCLPTTHSMCRRQCPLPWSRWRSSRRQPPR
jgi:hypothetical protein